MPAAEGNLFLVYAERLDALQMPYMITGSVAAMLFGEPRLTHDVDLVVELSDLDAARLESAFPPAEFYCPPADVIRVETARAQRGHFSLIEHATGFKADIYLVGTDPLHRWAMSRRRELVVEGRRIWVAPPEYVILRKLQYFHEGGSMKHLDDIRGMLRISADAIDIELVGAKARELGLEQVWRQAAP